MSSVICETVQSTFLMTLHAKQHGRMHWLFGSTRERERSSKPPVLRIVTSETLPSSSSNTNRIPSTSGVRALVPTASSRSDSTDAPDVIHQEQVQQHNVGQRSEVPFPRRPSGHARTQSTSAIGDSSANPGASSSERPHRRTRTASSCAGPRPRLLSSVLTQSKAPAQPRESTNDPGLLGSFAPTSSPRPRLRSLLSGTCAPPEFSGALTSSCSSPSQRPTPPPSRGLSASRSGHGGRASERHRPRHQSETPRARASVVRHWRPSDPTPIDPPASPDLPSICRTPSSYSDSDYFPTAPSSAGPTTPVHTAATLPFREGRKSKSETSCLHPVLENLERTSMFRIQTACATCGKHGSNFPCCPKCGEMWCSRPCRLQRGNGKRHICSKKAD